MPFERGTNAGGWGGGRGGSKYIRRLKAEKNPDKGI